MSRRLATIAGFYKYAVEEDLLNNSPAANPDWHRLLHPRWHAGWVGEPPAGLGAAQSAGRDNLYRKGGILGNPSRMLKG